MPDQAINELGQDGIDFQDVRIKIIFKRKCVMLLLLPHPPTCRLQVGSPVVHTFLREKKGVSVKKRPTKTLTLSNAYDQSKYTTFQGIMSLNQKALKNCTWKYLVSYVEGKGLFSSFELRNNLQILQKKNSLENV